MNIGPQRPALDQFRTGAHTLRVRRPPKARDFFEPLENRRLLSASVTTVATFNQQLGIQPENLVIDPSGDLFGTTNGGGPGGDGTVFEIKAGSHQVTTLVSFDGRNGGEPDGLMIDSAGNLYGTTDLDGDPASKPEGQGTIFEISAGSHKFATLADFNAGAQGGSPAGGLVEDPQGDLFGQAQYCVFELPAGSGAVKDIANAPLPDQISGSLAIDSAGNLYGGEFTLGPYQLFELRAGAHKFLNLATTPLYVAFSGSGVTRDPEGNLYGVAGQQAFQWPLGGSSTNPLSGLATAFTDDDVLSLDSQGNVFGVNPFSGASELGSIFKIAAGSGALSTVVAFDGGIGGYPRGNLVHDSAGNLYGTLENSDLVGAPAPPDDTGTVFEITGSGFVTANSPPVIFTQPTDQTGFTDGTTSFTAVVSSSPAPSVQWQVSDDGGQTFADITGNPSALAQTLSLTGLASAQNGDEYRAVFTNAEGTTISAPARLTVIPPVTVTLAHVSPDTPTTAILRIRVQASVPVAFKWKPAALPRGASRPSFSSNGTATSNEVTVTFAKAGYYRFRCTITDADGYTVATDVSVRVQQVATSLRLTPYHQTVATGQSLTFHAAVYDQFGHPLRAQPGATYSIASGPGTINPTTGLFSSDAIGTALIQAEDDGFSRTAGVEVVS